MRVFNLLRKQDAGASTALLTTTRQSSSWPATALSWPAAASNLRVCGLGRCAAATRATRGCRASRREPAAWGGGGGRRRRLKRGSGARRTSRRRRPARLPEILIPANSRGGRRGVQNSDPSAPLPRVGASAAKGRKKSLMNRDSDRSKYLEISFRVKVPWNPAAAPTRPSRIRADAGADTDTDVDDDRRRRRRRCRRQPRRAWPCQRSWCPRYRPAAAVSAHSIQSDLQPLSAARLQPPEPFLA